MSESRVWAKRHDFHADDHRRRVGRRLEKRYGGDGQI